MAIETVTVDRGGTPVRINKSDFDPDKDQLWADKLREDKTAKERSAEDKATKQERAREDAVVKRGRPKKDAD